MYQTLNVPFALTMIRQVSGNDSAELDFCITQSCTVGGHMFRGYLMINSCIRVTIQGFQKIQWEQRLASWSFKRGNIISEKNIAFGGGIPFLKTLLFFGDNCVFSIFLDEKIKNWVSYCDVALSRCFKRRKLYLVEDLVGAAFFCKTWLPGH